MQNIESNEEKETIEVVTPIEQMTDAELKAKADEFRALAEAEFRHADEIRRYIKWRGEQSQDEPDAAEREVASV